MASFTTVINALVSVLKGDAALTAYVASEWTKSKLTVKKTFRQRVELNVSDLPVILVTRPTVEKTYQLTKRDGNNTVRLYCGFHQTDRAKALDNLITFEEKIDDALLTGRATITAGGGVALNAAPVSSINDEGAFHPIYFVIIDLNIKHRR